MDRQRRFHLWRLSAVVVGMFAFGFALGPLYTALCEVTGINGKMKLVPAEELAVLTVDESRTVTVEFLTTVNGGRPWKFQASTPRLQVHPGRLYTVEFIAENTEAHDVIAQAVPNVAPWNAARPSASASTTSRSRRARKSACPCASCWTRNCRPISIPLPCPTRFLMSPRSPNGLAKRTRL
jgi:hypothetical protein